MKTSPIDPYHVQGGGAQPSYLINQSVEPVMSETKDCNAPAANTKAEITYAAETGKSHVISGVSWSYNADPTGGNLQIHDGVGHIFFSTDITSKGPGVITFPCPKALGAGGALVITLAAGGASVTGKLSVLNHFVA